MFFKKAGESLGKSTVWLVEAVAAIALGVSGAMGEMPAIAEKAVERHIESIERLISKLHRDHDSLMKLLQRQSEMALQRGDQRAAEALAEKAAELVAQLQAIEEAVENKKNKAAVFAVPLAAPQPLPIGRVQLISIRGDDKVGVSLGPMAQGTVIALQYVGGAWTNGTSTESPDETKNGWSQCCVAATSRLLNLHNDILEKVPLQTAHAPWHYRLKQNYENVSIRMGDDIYNGPGHSDNGGVAWYRIAIGR